MKRTARQSRRDEAILGMAPRGGGAAICVRIEGDRIVPVDAAAARDLARVIVVSDAAALYRKLDLPEAEDAALSKMAAAQLHGLLPGRNIPLAVGWSRLGSAGPGVLAVAMRQTAVDAAAGLSDGIVAAVPAGIAAVAAAERAGYGETRAAVVSVEPEVTTVLHVEGGRLSGAVVLDLGSDDDPDRWLHEVAEVVDAPRCCIIGDVDDEAAEALAEAIEAPVAMLSDVAGSLGVKADADTVRAAGAALAVRSGVLPHFALKRDKAGDRRTLQARRWMPLVAAAVWLLLAAASIVALDLAMAGDQAAAADEAGLGGPAVAQLDQQLALLRQLETRGPLPLAILDEIAAMTPSGLQYSGFSYASDRSITLTGEVEQEKQLGELLEALTDARTLDAVELRSQKRAERKIAFEIAATASPRFFAPFVEPQKKADEPVQSTPDREGLRPRPQRSP